MLFQTFNETDTVLKNVDVWPTIDLVSFFESKLTFQIQHSIFRTKVTTFTFDLQIALECNEIVSDS